MIASEIIVFSGLFLDDMTLGLGLFFSFVKGRKMKFSTHLLCLSVVYLHLIISAGATRRKKPLTEKEAIEKINSMRPSIELLKRKNNGVLPPGVQEMERYVERLERMVEKRKKEKEPYKPKKPSYTKTVYGNDVLPKQPKPKPKPTAVEDARKKVQTTQHKVMETLMNDELKRQKEFEETKMREAIEKARKENSFSNGTAIGVVTGIVVTFCLAILGVGLCFLRENDRDYDEDED